MTTLENLFSCFGDDYFDEVAQFSKRNEKAPGNESNDRYSKRKAEGDLGPAEKNKKKDPMLDFDIDSISLDPGIIVHTIAKDDGCLHEVAVPPKQKFPQLVESKLPPAKTYKFALDSFQKKAILCVENNQSVMVSAHTSAGKTVVAEYAIALALKNKQRVIYTTPIKALSNQKYREMLEEFKDVGLMTGDVTIDPMASCLIMTTEILRSMLFRGSEITKEVGWVIFDEIHYMRDKIRGVVWEETLILLPDNVRYVFLSATIPNARQFAEWVSHLHQQPCHVIYTEYRPTPLQHYLFPSSADGMHLVIDDKGQIIQKNFDAAMASVGINNSEDETPNKPNGAKPSGPSKKDCVYNVVNVLMERKLAPLIIFSFRKKECEIFATHLSKLNFNTDVEAKLVDEVFNNAIDILSEDEKLLPQITTILPLLRKGIAFHHSGLLPLVKETVEILFGEGLIKALFATETFAMGLNMPAKTVIFTSITKFDGVQTRNVSSGEYIQMSGRAGRRGLDANGLIVLMIDQKISSSLIMQVMMGKADPLNSAFHLTYNMILNLMRQEEVNPEYMIEKSFLIFQTRAKLFDLNRNLKIKQRKYSKINIQNEDVVRAYSGLVTQLEGLHEEIKFHTMNSKHILPFLHEGRLVKIKYDNHEHDWGIIMGVQMNKKRSQIGEMNIQLQVMLHVQGDSQDRSSIPKPVFRKKKGRVATYTIDYNCISLISTQTAKLPGKNRKERSKSFLKVINNLKAAFPHCLPALHPINDVGIDTPQMFNFLEKVNYLESLLVKNPVHGIRDVNLLDHFERKQNIEKEIFEIKDEMEQLLSILKMDELLCRKNVLRSLGYCNEMDVINMKGRVACELNCVDELLLTEMIFNGIFTELSVDYCVALLSCFICQELDPLIERCFDTTIKRPLELVTNIASMIGDISVDCKLIKKKEDYTEKCYQEHLVQMVLEWCRGATFLDICKNTKIYEGSIIRYLRMLEEVLRQLCKAATNVGNTDLENRFSEGIRVLKRGVVFAGSLYL